MLNNIISLIKPKSLIHFFHRLNFFRKKHLGKALHYVQGLWQGLKRFNLQTLFEATPASTYSYRQLHHFIDNPSWDEYQLNEKRIQFLENDVRTRTRREGAVVLDDTGVKKYGERTDGVAEQYYGLEGRIANCKVTVTSHYIDEVKDYPLDAQGYYPQDGESKIKLALREIDKAMRRNLSFGWILFDSWYCTKEVIKRVEKCHKYFVSKLNSNRVLIYQNERMKVSQLVKLASASFARSDEIIDYGKVQLKALGTYRLLAKEGECFITNNYETSPVEVINQYRRRWVIDDFYREVKDNLSFAEFQVRKGLSIIRHWMLVFLAYTFYIHCKLKGVFSKIYQGAITTLSQFTKVMQNLNTIRVAKEHTNVLLASFGFKTLN